MKAARIDFRLSEENKELFEAAAARLGLTLSDFATVKLREAALAINESYERTVLSNRDRDLFLAMLDDEEPNERLLRAAEKYKALRQEEERSADRGAGEAPR